MGEMMNKTCVALMEYGSNKHLKDIYMNGHIPCVGEYFIDDTKIDTETWKDNMYIVKAVTHFQDSLVALHVEKYNSEEETLKWKKAVEFWESMKGKFDNVENS